MIKGYANSGLKIRYQNEREIKRQESPKFKAFVKWLKGHKKCSEKVRRTKLWELCGGARVIA
jgi:hypothetical protein